MSMVQVSQSIGGVAKTESDTAQVLVQILSDLRINHAFGVSGGGIARVWQALAEGPIETIHCRSEAGAVFAATEASLAQDRPVAVFATTGPGITSTLTGLVAARAEGAKVVLLSASSSPSQRGRGAVQETPQMIPSADFFHSGWLFDDVLRLESVEELPRLAQTLRYGFSAPAAYIAHVNIPVSLQNAPAKRATVDYPALKQARPAPDAAVVGEVTRLMQNRPFAIWAGHGARRASSQIRRLAERTGAPVLATPRGKGVIPEDHPQFLMVTGLGGHPERIEELQRYGAEWTLVLGTRLSEPSSGWDPRLEPSLGYVQVDLAPGPLGNCSGAPTLSIACAVETFLDHLLETAADLTRRPFVRSCAPLPFPAPVATSSTVRPQVVLGALQRAAIETGHPVLVEPGSAMAWASNLLRPIRPGQLRIVGQFGSMCQMTSGVLGAAIQNDKAICLSGDGSMLMGNELNTAAAYSAPAVWVVLNDAKYAMCEKGIGFGDDEPHARFPRCDFAQVARAMGVDAEQVSSESEVEAAIGRAIESPGPYLVDVIVNPDEIAPFQSRLRTLS